jgi:hypothetical protein
MDTIKPENDSIGMKTKRVYVPSAIPLIKDEPEVSHVLR